MLQVFENLMLRKDYGACSMYGGEERREVHVGFWWADLRERNHLENLGIDERVILK